MLIILALNMFTGVLAQYRVSPNVSVVLLAVIIIYAFITTKTVFGRHIYAMGGNYEAARLNAATPKAGNLLWVLSIMVCH